MSEEVKIEIPEVTIEALAVQHRAIIKMDDEQLREDFDTFWKENGEMLSKQFNYKGKKLKGGKTDLKRAKAALEKSVGAGKLYARVVAEQLGDRVEAEEDRRVMTINAVSLHNFEGETQTMGVIQFFYWPEIHFDKDKLNLEITRRAKFDEEEHRTSRQNQLQQQHAMYTKFEGEGVNENQRVLIDVISACNGEAYDNLTYRGQWREINQIVPDEVKEAVLEHTSGDLFEIDFDNPVPGELNGENVHAHVKLYEVQDIELLDIEGDELYEASDFESKADFLKKFSDEFKAYTDNASKYQAFNEVITQIVEEASEIDPIPQRWYDVNVEGVMQRHIDQFKGDKNMAMRAAGAKDMEELQRKFEGQIHQESLQQCAINWYAKNFNTPNDAEAVSTDLLTKVIWSDPEE